MRADAPVAGGVSRPASNAIWPWLAMVVLVSAFVGQSYRASLEKSPVFDEPPHIASGLSYVAAHVFHANPQHPPLLKELSALSLSRGGVRWPASPEADALVRGEAAAANAEWRIGNAILAPDPDGILRAARAPFFLIGAGLGVVLFWWTRRMFGPVAAVGAVLLFACDPTTIAHTQLVTRGIFPDHLSYFNEAACLAVDPSRIGLDGGSRCGPQWLDDSNVDWGQGVKQLVDWQRAHAPDRTLKLAYFGTFPPEQYGLRYEKLDPATLLSRPAPGLYAISAFWVGRVPATVTSVAAGATSWLRDTAPDAVVGHAYYIYDVK